VCVLQNVVFECMMLMDISHFFVAFSLKSHKGVEYCMSCISEESVYMAWLM